LQAVAVAVVATGMLRVVVAVVGFVSKRAELLISPQITQ
jgi:uncharacterized membrane protein